MSALIGVAADGNTRVDYVPAIADPAAPKVSELTAAGAKNLSDYITADGLAPSHEQASIADSRLSSTHDGERPGRKTTGLSLTYVSDQQGTDDNDAYVTLKEGTDGYIVIRRSMPVGTAYAASQKVDVYKVTCGEQVKVATAANEVEKVTQKMFIPANGFKADAVVAS